MSINYYAVKKKPTLDRELHIGHSSCGWKFSFRSYKDDWKDLYILNVEDWKNYLKNGDLVILDEYSREVSYENFWKLVEDKQSDENPDNFKYSVNIDGYRFYKGDFR